MLEVIFHKRNTNMKVSRRKPSLQERVSTENSDARKQRCHPSMAKLMIGHKKNASTSNINRTAISKIKLLMMNIYTCNPLIIQSAMMCSSSIRSNMKVSGIHDM